MQDSNEILSSLVVWKECLVDRGFPFWSSLLFHNGQECRNSPKIKCSKRPCIYYANSLVAFNCILEGDLVFKQNPGPAQKECTSINSNCSHRKRTPLSTRARDPLNIITIDTYGPNKSRVTTRGQRSASKMASFFRARA